MGKTWNAFWKPIKHNTSVLYYDCTNFFFESLVEKYTYSETIHTLRGMNMAKLGDSGYALAYIRSELIDALHENAGFRTDYELTTPKSMAGLFRRSKGL